MSTKNDFKAFFSIENSILNWTLPKKIFTIHILCMIWKFSQICSSAYLLTIRLIMQYFLIAILYRKPGLKVYYSPMMWRFSYHVKGLVGPKMLQFLVKYGTVFSIYLFYFKRNSKKSNFDFYLVWAGLIRIKIYAHTQLLYFVINNMQAFLCLFTFLTKSNSNL